MDSNTTEKLSSPRQVRGAWYSSLRSYYLLILLGLAFGFAQLDRVIMSVLIEPIKVEFALSDTKIALLTGLAFALFNAVTIIPIGVLADKVNRRNLIALSLTVWSLMTVLGGMTVTFVQLLLTRVSVGFGEGGCSSPSLSVIADQFEPGKRATAISIFYIFGPLGGLIALAGGGWIVDNYGWRVTLVTFGLPGVLLAALLFLTTSEPKRGAFDTRQKRNTNITNKEAIFLSIKIIIECRSLLYITVGIALISVFISSIGVWTLTFFVRSHNLSIKDAGLFLALFQIIGLLGPIFGGSISDILAKYDQRWWCWVVAACLLLASVSHLGAMLTSSTYGALFAVGCYSLFAGVWYGPSYGMVQGLTPTQYRTTVTSIIIVLTNIVGFGLGVQYVGILSDILLNIYGVNSLRYALLTSVIFGIMATVCYLYASIFIRGDMERSGSTI